MRRLAAALVFASCCSVALAADHRWTLFAHASYVAPTGSEVLAGRTLEVRNATAWGLGAEWRFTFWGGLGLDYSRADYVWDLGGVEFRRADVDTLSLALNTHLIDTGAVDVYFGPVLSWVAWGDGVSPNGARVVLDDDISPGVQAGLDIGVTRWLAIATSIGYMKTDVQRGAISLDVDPVIARAGVAVRF